jgi:hypothetical protein
MVYWVKHSERFETIISSEGGRVECPIKSYTGPFRTFSDVEDFLKDTCVIPSEILEFEV